MRYRYAHQDEAHVEGNPTTRKLANSNWGAYPKTLLTTALALSYSTAEYSSAVWARSCHAKKVDAELNNACRIVTGQLRPTTLPLLYRTPGIAPPDIRRQTHGSTEKHKQETDLRHPLFDYSYPRVVKSVQPDQAASHRLELWNTWDNTTNEAIQPPKEQLPPGRELQSIFSNQDFQYPTVSDRAHDDKIKWIF
ncbi:RNA-directed DNA polymerase from mobile element jockey-like protein [Elysia marginata]|uniref:RNA-directed DNA polymerase from mobile element jockey-like protein n=1 Tax=Elysia marginata TaxID=1093978 RepID=A0AAV4HXD5_9GAST|nr:RNA-directed DNA polymerase from mobile element jockey-like protein [Elysia marginata]